MNATHHVIVGIDQEIVRLQQARGLLIAGEGSNPQLPENVIEHRTGAAPARRKYTRRTGLSAEGRKKISDAMKARWAAKAAAKAARIKKGTRAAKKPKIS